MAIPRTFKGLGVIACRLCGGALRDHDGPCQLRRTEAIDVAVGVTLRMPAEVHRNGSRIAATNDPFGVEQAAGLDYAAGA